MSRFWREGLFSPVMLPPNCPPLSTVFFADAANQRLLEHRKCPVPSRAQNIQLLLLTVVVLIASLILAAGLQQLLVAFQLDHSGAVTQGQIISRRIAVTGGNGRAINYYVTYQFALPDMQTVVTNEQFVRKEIYDQLVESSPVRIKYLDSDPGISILPDWAVSLTQRSNGYLYAVFGGLALAIALLYFAPAAYRFFRGAQRRRSGQVLVGHVLACHRYVTQGASSLNPEVYGSALKSQFYIELAYSFRLPQGKEVKGVARRRRNDLKGLALPKFGSPVLVLYAREDNYDVL